MRAASTAEVPNLASMLDQSFAGLSRRVLGKGCEKARGFWEGVLEETWGCGDWLVVEDEDGNLCGMGWLTYKAGANPLVSNESCREFGGQLRGRWICWKLGQFNTPALKAGEAYLDWMAVRPAHRGRGCGHRLLEGIVQQAKLKACRVLKLDVETGNRAAIGLYVDLGFREGSARWKPILTLLYGCGKLMRMELELERG